MKIMILFCGGFCNKWNCVLRTYSPVLDSEYPSNEEYSDNEVCNEDEWVNNFQ